MESIREREGRGKGSEGRERESRSVLLLLPSYCCPRIIKVEEERTEGEAEPWLSNLKSKDQG